MGPWRAGAERRGWLGIAPERRRWSGRGFGWAGVEQMVPRGRGMGLARAGGRWLDGGGACQLPRHPMHLPAKTVCGACPPLVAKGCASVGALTGRASASGEVKGKGSDGAGVCKLGRKRNASCEKAIHG